MSAPSTSIEARPRAATGAVATGPPPRAWAGVRRPVPARGATVLEGIRSRLAAARAVEHPPPERYGFDIDVATRLFAITRFFYRRYFRTQCFGIENLPDGPLLLVANHGSHVLSWDGANIVSACLFDAEPPRLVHGMAEHRLLSLPILGSVARRIGAVDGNPTDCRSLLEAGAAVLTFPEGARALAKPFGRRYQVCDFGQGFMRLAMATGVPIVPVAVVGSEEEAPLIASPRWLARLLRVPVAPLTPTVFVPLPVRYRLHFGAALRFAGSARDERRVRRNVAEMRGILQSLIDAGLERRPHVFF